MEIKVSIITINYNNNEGLQKTIRSVISQTYTNFEYLVIDGGSVDGSLELIKKYSNKISYWVSERDNGIYHAMNKGIFQAKGEFVQFLNSGDWFCDGNVLSRVFKCDFSEDIIYGNLQKLFTDNKIKIDKGFQRSQLTLADMYSGTINHASSFIRRNLFFKHGMYDEQYKIVSDWAFFLKTVGFGKASVKYIDEDIACFDMNGISNKQIALRREEHRQELEKTIPPFLLPDYEELMTLRKKVTLLDKIEDKLLSRLTFKIYRKLFL